MAEDAARFTSACGIFDCETCIHRTRSRCIGCSQGNALMSAQGESSCSVYGCAKSRDIASCKECTEPMCSFTRHPEMVCPVRARFEKKRSYTRKISNHFKSKQETNYDGTLVARKLDKVITRLPWYLFAAEDFIKYGVTRVSSDEIARKVGIKDWLVRRDLSQFGEFGRPSVGYETEQLRKYLSEILNLHNERKTIWIGATRMEAQKALIPRFCDYNYKLVAIFDTDLSRVPEMINGIRVSPLEEMPEMIAKLDVEFAVIATIHGEEQKVAEALFAAGIKGILNITPTLITAPPNVTIRNICVMAEMLTLSFHCNKNESEPSDN